MTADQLLNQMVSVLRMHGQWQARATDCDKWGAGATPHIAMEQALALRDGAPTDDDLGDLF